MPEYAEPTATSRTVRPGERPVWFLLPVHPPARGGVLGQIGLRGVLKHPADVDLVGRLDAKRGGGVSMRIKVDDQGGDSRGQCRRGQSGRDGGLADPAFEAADAHYLHLKTNT